MIAPRSRSVLRAAGQRRRGGAQPGLVAGTLGAESRRRGSAAWRRAGTDSAAHSLPAQRRVAIGERLAELAALGGERRHQLDKALLGGMPRDDRQRLGEARLRRRSRAATMTLSAASASASRGAALVDDGEFRRDAGLERKAAQQRLAEGVDRRDLDAARQCRGRARTAAAPAPIFARRDPAGQLDAAPRRACRPAASPSRPAAG